MIGICLLSVLHRENVINPIEGVLVVKTYSIFPGIEFNGVIDIILVCVVVFGSWTLRLASSTLTLLLRRFLLARHHCSKWYLPIEGEEGEKWSIIDFLSFERDS